MGNNNNIANYSVLFTLEKLFTEIFPQV